MGYTIHNIESQVSAPNVWMVLNSELKIAKMQWKKHNEIGKMTAQ